MALVKLDCIIIDNDSLNKRSSNTITVLEEA